MAAQLDALDASSALERRRAPDGELYTKFFDFFGGLEEWTAAAPRRRVAANSRLFTQVVGIQHDRKSYQAMDPAEQKSVKRWQSSAPREHPPREIPAQALQQGSVPTNEVGGKLLLEPGCSSVLRWATRRRQST